MWDGVVIGMRESWGGVGLLEVDIGNWERMVE